VRVVLPGHGDRDRAMEWRRPPLPGGSGGAGPGPAHEVRAEVFGDAVRSLNSAQAGFRTLLPRTVTALRNAAADSPETGEHRSALGRAAILARAAARHAAPIPTRNLLAAVDLKRDDAGSRSFADISANRTIMLRTFTISLMVTLLCAAIGLPYAMIAAQALWAGCAICCCSPCCCRSGHRCWCARPPGSSFCRMRG
jgi:hypothetical protein